MRFLKKISPFLINKVGYFVLFYTLILLNAEVEMDFSTHFFCIGIFFISFVGVGIFGYIINDISDEGTDRLSGKLNLTSKLTNLQKLLIVFFALAIGVVPISYICLQTFPFILSEIALLLLYSFPPIRLKERGYWGIITDSVYAYSLPSVILLVYLGNLVIVPSFFWYFLPIFSIFIGIKNIINHQLEDLDNDIISGVKTFATRNPNQALFFMTNTTLLSCTTWIIAIPIVCLIQGLISITVICYSVIGIPFLLKTIHYFLYRENKYLQDIPESDLVYYGIITILLYGIIKMEISVLYLMLFFITPYFRERIHKIILPVLSTVVNYGLYYSFLLVGVNLKKRAEAKKQVSNIVPRKKITVTEIREKNVHGLWIGNELSLMELLTIHSFIHHGYTFHLWTYEPIKNTLPKSCICFDANEIIPKECVFRYKYKSQYGTGKGSYAGFSDIFRYKLLYEKGGWWVDMDVTCLKPFDVETPYFFRSHHDLPMVGNIMKAPKGSELMLKCYQEALLKVDESNRDWHKPIEILVNNIYLFDFQKYIYSETSNTDEWHIIRLFVSYGTTIPKDWYFLHWCNEMWRTNGFSKNEVMYSSQYAHLLMRYKLIPVLEHNEWIKKDRNLRLKLCFDNFLTSL